MKTILVNKKFVFQIPNELFAEIDGLQHQILSIVLEKSNFTDDDWKKIELIKSQLIEKLERITKEKDECKRLIIDGFFDYKMD